MLTPPLYSQQKDLSIHLNACEKKLQANMLLLFQKYNEKEILLEDIYINLNKIISKQKFIISTVTGVRLGRKKIIDKTFKCTSTEEIEKQDMQKNDDILKEKESEQKENEEEEDKQDVNKTNYFDKNLVKQVHMQDTYYINNLKQDEIICIANMFNEEIFLKNKYKYSKDKNSYEQTYNYYVSLKQNKSYNTYMLNILNFILGRRYSALLSKKPRNNSVKVNKQRKSIYKEIQNNLFSANKYNTRIKMASNFFIKTMKYYKFIINNGFNFLFNKSFNRSYIKNISNNLYERLIASSHFANNNDLFAVFLQALNKGTFICKKLTLIYSSVNKQRNSLLREDEVFVGRVSCGGCGVHTLPV